MNKWVYVLIGVVFTIIVGLNIYLWVSLKNQQDQFNTELRLNLDKIDSLNKQNDNYLFLLSNSLNKIDSLDKIIININKEKQLLESKLDDFKFQNNLDSNVILLRQNIWNELH